MRLDVAVRRYLRAQEVGGASPLTVKQRRSQLGRFERWCADRSLETAASVKRAEVEQYQRHLFHFRGSDGRPLSRRTQHHLLSAVAVFFRWLVENGHLAKNPTSRLELPKFERSLPRNVLRPDEVAAILDAIDTDDPLGLRDRAILEVLYSSGIRRAELRGLDLGDIDFERGLLRVRQGKGGRDRVVPFGARAAHWLDRYVLEVRPLHERCDCTAVFLGQRGGRLGVNRLSTIAKTRIGAADLGKEGSCHLFRHSVATSLLDAGADVRHIQELLGHADIGSTAVYTHVSVAKLKEVHTRCHPAKWKE